MWREGKRRHRLTIHQLRCGTNPLVIPRLENPPPPPEHTPSTRPRLQRAAAKRALPTPTSTVIPSLLEFYAAHPGDNTLLQIRQGDNITGDPNAYGVFAKTPISAGTKLAPYVGYAGPSTKTGPYCLLARDERSDWETLDAEDVFHDVGYLLPLSEYKKSRTQLPPSYGRFVNTIRPDQHTPDLTFNSALEPDTEGDFSWLVATKDVHPGQEILVAYGNKYQVPPPLSTPHPQILPHSKRGSTTRSEMVAYLAFTPHGLKLTPRSTNIGMPTIGYSSYEPPQNRFSPTSPPSPFCNPHMLPPPPPHH